jgi:hypothetical protein
VTPRELMDAGATKRRHTYCTAKGACKDHGDQARQHCDECGQEWPCDARRMAELVIEAAR